MIVKISADWRRGERGYEGAEIKLPANHFALADALQRAQVPEGGGYSLHKFADCPDPVPGQDAGGGELPSSEGQ